MSREILVALAGNPNVGKSTLFNALTGATAHVANWPGVTVELREGRTSHHGVEMRIVDLPGTYSIGGVTEEAERVAREFLISERPDVVVVLADATALERTMYLPLMVMEITPRVVVAVNMMDVAARRAIHVDLQGISAALGVPVVGISALRGEGIGALLDRVLAVAEGREGRKHPLRIDYDGLEPYISRIEKLLVKSGWKESIPARWAALRLLEGDPKVAEAAGRYSEEVKSEAERVRSEAGIDLRIPPDQVAVESRYRYIDRLLRGRVRRTRLLGSGLSEALDRVALHPLGGPIFSLGVMLGTFFLAFVANMGFPLNLILYLGGMPDLAEAVEELSLTGLLGGFFEWLGAEASAALSNSGAPGWLVSLVCDGVISGVGAVLSFLPLVLTVYLLLGALQDTGILARSAVSLHKFLRKFGLSGRSVFPAVVGFGCNVPAVMATRALDDDRERMIMAMTSPIIPCQARLVVMLALAGGVTRDPGGQALVMLAMYSLSVVLWLAVSALISRFMFRVRSAPELVMEIPPYHRPSLKVIWWYARTNTEHFLTKAGTLILGFTVALWFLLHFGPSGFVPQAALESDPSSVEGTFAAALGKALAPLGSLVGLPDWRMMLAFEAGFLAKEAVISILVTTTGAPDPAGALRALGMTPLQSLALTVAMMTYTPCVATLAAIKQELRYVKYVWRVVAYEIAMAILLAAAVYWGGVALGLS